MTVLSYVFLNLNSNSIGMDPYKLKLQFRTTVVLNYKSYVYKMWHNVLRDKEKLPLPYLFAAY